MKFIASILLTGLLSSVCRADSGQSLKSFDGYRLDYEIDYPADKNVSRVVVLVHGSGPQDMREDLSAASATGTKNWFFTDLSAALTAKGFAVVRYNKRSYQLNEQVKKDPAFAKTSKFKKLAGHQLDAIVKDAAAFAGFAAKTFPKAKVYLLGHSEGTYVALQVADADKAVAGVALIGFTTQGRETVVFEQFVYRPLSYFDALDADRNGVLTPEELGKDEPVSKSLVRQMPVIDLNKNGLLERSEYIGGNLSNMLQDSPAAMEWRQDEAARKKPAGIIRDAAFDVSFFQGELDNQTPSYNAKAIQLANALAWKKPNLHFRFFEGLGHALDKRADYKDLVFKTADPQALAAVAADLDGYLK
jgi:pimeloyl-ACP methyl ester carboxylesterase